MNETAQIRLQFDTFNLDEGNARLFQDGRPIELPPRAFAVLCALARQPGQLVTKNQLLDAVWGHQHVSESVLKTTISELRAALSDDAKKPRYIETAARRGYRFIAAVNPWQAQDSPPVLGFSPISTAIPSVHQLEIPSIIGRKTALAQLQTAWNSAMNGHRQIVWVVGEAGIGKTTLIDNFVSGLGSISCAFGQCVEQHGAGEPYMPVLETLGTLCRNDPTLVRLLRSVAPTWLFQLPWLSDEAERASLRHELAGVGYERMLREFGELLEQYTQHQPLLIVTEDLHWSDHATIHLINHIARRRVPARFMWLASFRLAEVIAEEHPLKMIRHELRLHQLCQEIMLEHFTEQEVANYIGQRFPNSEISEPFVRTLYARTDGLPLFVANVIDNLTTNGVLNTTADLNNSLQIPENLVGIIEKQIARLSAEQQALLEAASVCGIEFQPDTVGDALQRDLIWISERCEELARQQHWLHAATIAPLADGSLHARYTFRHALYRHVFYQRIGMLARAQLHRRTAISLEHARSIGIAVTAAELAMHYELGHELMAALRYYAEAAENAMRHFAPREGIKLCDHALSLLSKCPANPMRDAIELTLSAMRGAATGQLSGVSTLAAKNGFERARELLEVLPQHPLRHMVLHGLGMVLVVRGEYAQARAVGEHAYQLSQQHDDRTLLLSACSVLGQAHTLQGNQYEGRKWLELGIAACKEVGDEALQAAFLVDPGVTMHAALAIPLCHLGFVDQAIACIETATARAKLLREPMAKMVAAWFGALLYVRLGDIDKVAELAENIKNISENAALAQGYGPSRWYRGWCDARRDSPKAGYHLIREAFQRNAGIGMLCGGSEVLGYATEALILAGEWQAARVQFEEAMQLVQQLSERVHLPQLHMLRARIALAKADIDDARENMQTALQEARAQGAPWLELFVLVGLCELSDPSQHDMEALRKVYAQLSEGHDTGLFKKARELLERVVQ